MIAGPRLLAFLVAILAVMTTTGPVSAETKLSHFPESLLSRDDFFPLAVWLQDPGVAADYKTLGINLYVGLWQGPTSRQLAQLKAARMPVISRMNQTGLTDPNGDIIVGWMMKDEPDNVQGEWKSDRVSPPLTPGAVNTEYQQMREADPTRPILLNLGQGVAWDQWHGRGPRTNHPEDYPKYVRSGDIISFDIYPVTHSDPAVSGKLEFVARGIDRLINWTHGKKPVWSFVGASRIGNAEILPTAEQIRSQVWLSIIHGATGIVYFVHQFKPSFVEASLLENSRLRDAVRRLNARVSSLAPVLKGDSKPDLIEIAPTTSSANSISLLVKQDGCTLFVFAGNRSKFPGDYRFSLTGSRMDGEIDVLDENRTIQITKGRFDDQFGPYDIHLYKITSPSRVCS